MTAEAYQVVAYTGSTNDPKWIWDEEAEALLRATPEANISAQQVTQFVQRILVGVGDLQPKINAMAELYGEELLESHKRVRTAARVRGVRYSVQAQLPPDILGVYLLLPII